MENKGFVRNSNMVRILSWVYSFVRGLGERGDTGDPGGGKPPTPPSELVVKGEDGAETKYSVDDVVNLVKEVGSLKGEADVAKVIKTAAAKYGVDPQDYVSQAEGVFALVDKLMTDGILDEEGKVVSKPKPSDPPRPPVPTPPASPKPVGEEKITEIVNKALAPLKEENEALRTDLSNMMRADLSRQIRAKFPEDTLSEDDINRVFGRAMADRNKEKDLFGHAEDLVKEKRGFVADLRKRHAEEFGIKNLEEFDEMNKLKQTEGGGVFTFMKGKKLAFRKGKGDKDTVTPMEATMELHRRRQAEERGE